jgi:agmatinase
MPSQPSHDIDLPGAPGPTFAGFPACDDLRLLDADIAIIGVPFGVRYPGQEEHSAAAPRSIREASQRLGRFLTHFDFNAGGPVLEDGQIRIVDCGDLPRAAEGEQNAATEAAIRAILDRGAVPIVLGGDHSIPFPVLRAYERIGSVCVVLIDAHIDYRDEVQGVRDGLSSGMRRAHELPWVNGMVQIGTRGVGSARPGDVADADRAGVVRVLAADIHRHGIEAAIAAIPAAEHYYITFDMDGIDPSIAPGVLAPAFGGLTYFQALDLLRGLAQRGRVVGMDVVEVAPALDLNAITSRLAAQLVLDMIGALSRAQFRR